MRHRSRGNFVAISGILVAAVLSAVGFFTWEYFGASEQDPKPRVVYGASGTAYASQRPSRQNVETIIPAAPLGENKGLKDPEPAEQERSFAERPEQPKTVRKKADVPVTIAASAEKGKWIFIDKAAFRLYLADGKEVVDSWGVAVGKVPGDKRKKGDMRTPEGMNFSVQQIQDARTWTHDFGDGKGVIKGAYGPWFIRLKTGWSGIGIHGTHDPDSIGTLASEGCIRLKNEDLVELHKHVKVGMRVVIGPNAGGPYKADEERRELKPAPEKANVKAAPAAASGKNAPKAPARAGNRKSGKRK
ncbi:MAG: L,D-transpeptidase [Pyramidobacter sp.]|nr:L,D-transpeptidase [Pyramidobacter sp.]